MPFGTGWSRSSALVLLVGALSNVASAQTVPPLPTVPAGFSARILTTDPLLIGPGGMAFDSMGNRLVVLDARGNGISGDSLYTVSLTGAVALLAALPGAALCTTHQVAVDSQGRA